jgi:hypothetical protein
MRAATELTRAQKLMEATRVIQSALLLGRNQVPSEDPAELVVAGRAVEKFIIDLTPDVSGGEITAALQGPADTRSEGSRRYHGGPQRRRIGRWARPPRRSVSPFRASVLMH